MSDSLFDKIGGEEAVDAAVELFYKKVLADNRIKHFFEETDMESQKRKQKAFLTYAFGGSDNYNGKGMRAAHKNAVENGLDDNHFDAVIENLGATLSELGVPSDLIGEAAAIAISTKDDVLNK
ncbi:MAG: group 1 truncated hemoglobin [Planctomycetota bacterium]|nr:MAG: group 1 truncated hemoglobin [Planctomycetota bacterium]